MKLIKSGKIRNIYEVNSNMLLIVTTDKVSAFDYELNQIIPYKGNVLNKISEFWFSKTNHIIYNHMITTDINTIFNILNTSNLPAELGLNKSILNDKLMLVHKLNMLPIECIVRGYIVGSGWKSYQENNTVCGIKLESGLKQAQELQEPIFTPSTKVSNGHDINISFKEMRNIIGTDESIYIRDKSLALYIEAKAYAASKGIILADSKLEYGLNSYDNRIMLGDEAFTPDSSRFWDINKYEVGKMPPSLDKQDLRNYLSSINWKGNSYPPTLPESLITNISKKYINCCRVLTGYNVEVGGYEYE